MKREESSYAASLPAYSPGLLRYPAPCSGSLGEALSLPLLEALASNATVRRHAPDLAESLQKSLAKRRSAASYVSAAQDTTSSVFAVHAFTSDGQAKRSKVSSYLNTWSNFKWHPSGSHACATKPAQLALTFVKREGRL